MLEPGHVEVRNDYPDPEPRDGGVVVDVEVCGICGSDLMDWYVGQKVPTVLGHEIVGRVASIGAPGHGAGTDGAGTDGAATDGALAVGDRVFVHHHVPCGACHHCRRGRETLCSGFRSSRIEPGGLAEKIFVPATYVQSEVLRLPPHLASETATLIEPLACCLRGIAKAGVGGGDSALVVGLGQMGQLYGRALSSIGVRVLGADPVRERRTIATRAGIDAVEPDPQVLGEIVREAPLDLIALCSGREDVLSLGLLLAGRGTTVQLFAPPPPGEKASFEPNRLFFDEVTIQASYSAGPDDTRRALSFLAEGTLDVSGIVSDRYPLEQTTEALEAARAGGAVMKVVVTASPERSRRDGAV